MATVVRADTWICLACGRSHLSQRESSHCAHYTCPSCGTSHYSSLGMAACCDVAASVVEPADERVTRVVPPEG